MRREKAEQENEEGEKKERKSSERMRRIPPLPSTKLEARVIRFRLCNRRAPAIDELDSIYSR
ncbi:hypothetical protein TorRG33x02_053960 [Trema orientale]|uniref:Uncharacterized protein n=1 Tax=Trema orientale TaxID=63057 RepID=A0A2P5FLV7_TREOI|nr:hypothetical protein TorRG33x02_053960 [Trema orientale]